jgi:hypothetical protein
MVPGNFMELEALPMTPNGKIDRKSLPSLEELTAVAEQKAELETEEQKTMAGIWSELIGIPTIGPDDNFFQLGGHSLLAIKALKRIAETFGTELRPRLLIMDNLREVTRRAARTTESAAPETRGKTGRTEPRKGHGLLSKLKKRGSRIAE